MSLDSAQFNELKQFLAEQQRDLVTASHQSKDSEISSLHREILTKIQDVKTTVDSHDITIKEITKLMPDITEAIKAYKATGIITKAVIGLVLGVPALAACVAGVIYFIDLTKK